MTVRLFDYWRSSASYRVRIALNLKGVAYQSTSVNLIEGDQRAADNIDRNSQGFVPTLEIEGLRLTQSLAIIDYLDARYPEPPMVSSDPARRARTLALALVIACDIHPLNNLRVLKYLSRDLGLEEDKRDDWYRHWVVEGLTALEDMAQGSGTFLGGDAPDMADVCLVPQMYNARRFDVDMTPFPTLLRIDAAAQALPAFVDAHPDAVKPR